MTLTYTLDVDWDGDGTLDGVNEATRMYKFTVDRGRDRTIGSPGSGFEKPNVGKMIIELDNHDGRYDPWNSGGALYGNIRPGRKCLLSFEQSGSTDSYPLFTGFISDIRPYGYKERANLIAEDGAGWLNSRYPNIALMPLTDVGGAIDAILTDLSYPYSTNIDKGIETIPYYWTTGANALSEIHKLANSDLGRFCVEADGTARFRNRHSSESVENTITEDLIGKNIYIPMPWDYSRSIVDIYIYPRIVGSSDSTLWTLRDEFTVSAGNTQEIWCQYTYENQVVPADDVYISSWQPTTAFATTDIDLTAFSQDAKVNITNTTAGAETLTELIIKGTPIYSPDKSKITASSTDLNIPAVFVFDYPWLANVNTATSYASLLLNYLSDTKVYPEIWIYNRPDIIRTIDIEQRLRLVLDTFDIDQTFFVNKISFESGASAQELITKIKLHPMLQDVDDDVFILDSVTNGILDTNKLGF